ncbi:MAG: metallophosphoesterase, partial [Planctomycetaceae bacterium]|nr:metallophosphoesterase [Planctomycetaceae bacterium]
MKLTKREFLKTLTIGGIALVGGSFNYVKGAENNLPRFAVMSDTHFGSNTGYGSVAKVSRALRNIVQKGNLDAIFVVGDLTDNGSAAQYDLLLKVFKDTSIIPESQRVVFMMGNHEFYNKEKPFENYAKKIGQPLHQYLEIKGYPFITLSLNSGNASDYSKESQQFFAEKIEAAAQKYPDKPIFIFSHTPPQNTCYGSKSWGASALLETLNKYPQAIIFSGHTHTPIGDSRMVWQGNFTSINDGST